MGLFELFRLFFERILNVYLYSCIIVLYVDECSMYDRLAHVITIATVVLGRLGCITEKFLKVWGWIYSFGSWGFAGYTLASWVMLRTKMLKSKQYGGNAEAREEPEEECAMKWCAVVTNPKGVPFFFLRGKKKFALTWVTSLHQPNPLVFAQEPWA